MPKTFVNCYKYKQNICKLLQTCLRCMRCVVIVPKTYYKCSKNIENIFKLNTNRFTSSGALNYEFI